MAMRPARGNSCGLAAAESPMAAFSEGSLTAPREAAGPRPGGGDVRRSISAIVTASAACYHFGAMRILLICTLLAATAYPHSPLGEAGRSDAVDCGRQAIS